MPPFDIMSIKPLPLDFFERKERGETVGDDPLSYLDDPDPEDPSRTLREAIAAQFGGTDVTALSHAERLAFWAAWQKRPKD